MELTHDGINAFNRNNLVIRKFVLYPSTTEYHEVGKRNFTTTMNVEDKIKSAIEFTNLDSGIGARGVVRNELELVKLSDGCSESIEIDGGIGATRYVFIIVVDDRQMSGNITRTFLKGYTSALDFSMAHNGRFSAAVPMEAEFYIDSVSTVTLAKSVRGGVNNFIVTDDHKSDHVLKTNNGVPLNVTRPVDVGMNNYVLENMKGVTNDRLPNTIDSKGSEKLSDKINGSTTLYSKKLIDGVLNALHDSVGGYSNEYEETNPLNVRDVYVNLQERDMTRVPFLQQLTMNNGSLGAAATVITVRELMDILNVYTLDGIIEVIPHTLSDIEANAITALDADNLGRDTITVGVHDLFNNIQAILGRSGVLSLEFSAVINNFNPDDKYFLGITNFNTIYGNSVDENKLNFIINNLKSSIITLCLEPLDRYMRFEDDVHKHGGYSVHVKYEEFTDCIVTIEIGEERMIFRYPTFASASLSPVTNRDVGNMTLASIGSTLRNLRNEAVNYQNRQTGSVAHERNYYNPENPFRREVSRDDDNGEYYPGDYEDEGVTEFQMGF